MIVREVYSEIVDGKRVTGERFIEMPGVLTSEEAAAENGRQAREAQAKSLETAALLDLINASNNDATALARVRAAAEEIRRLRETNGSVRTPPVDIIRRTP